MDVGGGRRVFFLVSLLFQWMLLRHGTPAAAAEEISIGLILSLETISGRSSLTTMRMAVDDFYVLHNNYTTRILLRPLDSKQDAVDAAAAALDLMKNSKIAAIIGPETTPEAEFVAVLGNVAQTPILSYSASSPSLSVTATPYFIRATVKDSDQSPLIAAIVKYYGWHEVIPIYEDTTILANRSNYVDFTLPYTESGVAMVVPLVRDNTRHGWIFLKPLTTDLWLSSLALFLFTGLVVWAIEHRINPEFRGRPDQQIGTTLYFVFATLVFSHKEKLESNLSRMVVVIWVFVVLILTSSYTASLTSMLTVQQLQPKADNISRLLQMNSRVGYQEGSFVFGMLQRFGFSKDRLQHYSTPEQYKDAMLNGSSLGGVDAIFDEIPYLKLFLSQYCANFTMVGRIYKTDGFGFVFPRGSPLVADVSRAILNVTEDDIMINIARKWFGDRATCPASGSGDTVSSSSIDFWRFRGLFLITGTLSILSILPYIGIFIWNKKRELELSCKDAVNNDDGLLQRSGALSISDVSAANFSSPETARTSAAQD